MPQHSGPGRVYLFRGQGWIFSSGWAQLQSRLIDSGIRAEDISNHAGNWAANDLIADHKAGRLSGPVVFVGHSRGGRTALAVAERVAQEGIRIELVLAVDVAIPPPVPGGVKRAVNLYLTRPRLYPARPFQPLSGTETTVENIDLDAPDSPVPASGLNHLNITNSPEIQDYLYRQIMAVMGTPR